MPIHDLCFKSVVFVPRDASLEEAAAKMKSERVGALVVQGKNHRIVGVLTDRDIVIGGVAAKMPMTAKVSELMSRDVLQVPRSAGLAEVIEKMEAREVRRALVVDREGKPCGFVSADDLIQLLGNELSSLGRLVSQQVRNEGLAEAV